MVVSWPAVTLRLEPKTPSAKQVLPLDPLPTTLFHCSPGDEVIFLDPSRCPPLSGPLTRPSWQLYTAWLYRSIYPRQLPLLLSIHAICLSLLVFLTTFGLGSSAHPWVPEDSLSQSFGPTHANDVPATSRSLREILPSYKYHLRPLSYIHRD